jgi:hypothetical protein
LRERERERETLSSLGRGGVVVKASELGKDGASRE